jgi:hypothetical protein
VTLSDFATLSTAISGVAVLISLVYLALQVRQTERNQRALMNQGAVARSVGSLALLTQQDLSDLMARVVAGETKFSAGEAYRIQTILRISLLSLQDNFVQHRAGLVDQITYDNLQASSRRMFSLAAFRALWKDNHMTFAPELRELVDGIITETPLAGPLDLAEQLNNALASAASPIPLAGERP